VPRPNTPHSTTRVPQNSPPAFPLPPLPCQSPPPTHTHDRRHARMKRKQKHTQLFPRRSSPTGKPIRQGSPIEAQFPGFPISNNWHGPLAHPQPHPTPFFFSLLIYFSVSSDEPLAHSGFLEGHPRIQCAELGYLKPTLNICWVLFFLSSCRCSA